MRSSIFLLAAVTLALTGCSSGRVVVASGPHGHGHGDGPPHSVQGPVASLGIPPGHYPPPGHCRVWIPGRPAGHQPAPVTCASLGANFPLGAWVLYRPVGQKKFVEVTSYHETRAAIVVSIDWYDAGSGKLLAHGPDDKKGKGKPKKNKGRGKS